jgi:hypothetical protein
MMIETVKFPRKGVTACKGQMTILTGFIVSTGCIREGPIETADLSAASSPAVVKKGLFLIKNVLQ